MSRKCCIIQVELEFTIKSIIYNTTKANYKCSLGNHLCSLKLSLLGTDAAVLTSPGHKEVKTKAKGSRLLISFVLYYVFQYFLGPFNLNIQSLSFICEFDLIILVLSGYFGCSLVHQTDLWKKMAHILYWIRSGFVCLQVLPMKLTWKLFFFFFFSKTFLYFCLYFCLQV